MDIRNCSCGRPILYVTGNFSEPGNYSFGSSISTDVLTINVQNIIVPVNPVSPIIPEINAANEVISIQNTGIPFAH